MSFRLLHEEDCKFGIICLLQFHGNCRNIKKISKSVSGILKVFRRNAVVGKLETEIARDIDKFLVRVEPKRCILAADPSGKYF